MRYLLLCMLLLLLHVSVISNIISAKSGSKADLEEAISKAKIGDVVRVPAGEYSCDGNIRVKAGITLMGAGQGRTILRLSEASESGGWVFRIDCANGEEIRITGFTFIGRAPKDPGGMKMINGCTNFRIDHNTFERCFSRAVEMHGNSKGVIDHNRFIDNWYTAIVVFGDGNDGWERDVKLGSDDAVYVEDNYFKQNNIASTHMAHHIASNNGSRYVFRYNTIDDGDLASHSIDAHGNKFYWERGSRCVEIYGNTIKAVHRWAGMNIRGGDGVIFDNMFEGDFVSPIHLMHEGRDGDGKCEYPCVDQIRKMYIWDNTYNKESCPVKVRHPDIVEENRDYFLSEMPDYTPFEYPHPLAKNPTSTAVLNRKNPAMMTSVPLNFECHLTNGTVLIRYRIPPDLLSTNSSVQIRIYNAQGRVVRTIMDTSPANGIRELQWNPKHGAADKLARGLYTFEFKTQSFTKSQTLMLLD